MKKELVKQDYRLVNARYKLSTNEQKLILFGISSISEKDPDDMVYSIKVSDLGDELANESLKNKHTRLKEFCESLLQKPVYIPDDSGGFLIANWFSSLRYVRGEGLLKYRISTDLKPYLVDLKKRFVQYNLQNILPLSSTYSIRIYQLLKEYEKIGRREFNLIDLQNMLDVPQSMTLYSNFKLKVLTIASREINEYTDINFKYEEIKTGKKVTSLRFIILNPDEKVETQSEKENKRIGIFLSYINPSFRKEAKKVLQRFLHLSDSVIISNIRLTSSDKRESFAAFLTAALKDDYAENSRGVIDQLESAQIITSDVEIDAKKCFEMTWLDREIGICDKFKSEQHINVSEVKCFWCANNLLKRVVHPDTLKSKVIYDASDTQ